MAAHDDEMDRPAFGYAGHEDFSEEAGLSVREYAAIALRVPDSGCETIDKMIAAASLSEMAIKLVGNKLDGLALHDEKSPGDTVKAIEIVDRAIAVAKLVVVRSYVDTHKE